jgi:hypothetical protein
MFHSVHTQVMSSEYLLTFIIISWTHHILVQCCRTPNRPTGVPTYHDWSKSKLNSIQTTSSTILKASDPQGLHDPSPIIRHFILFDYHNTIFTTYIPSLAFFSHTHATLSGWYGPPVLTLFSLHDFRGLDFTMYLAFTMF